MQSREKQIENLSTEIISIQSRLSDSKKETYIKENDSVYKTKEIFQEKMKRIKVLEQTVQYNSEK